jgi:tetratricopeptide (TPR) repeat protein
VAAQPVVQAIPGAENRALNAALARLAANPRDGAALIDAGNAALAMNDVDAAIGFFTRAEQVVPGDPRAKAGLAGAYVRNEDPFTAIRLFDEAERQGPLPGALVIDRGLAYDLVGDNATAQRLYRQAGPGNDEAMRRLALSLAISGDQRGSEAALSPLITRQDKSAWRVRAFSLAILGQHAQAVSIANATMPATLASGIAPYLRYMPQLTRAQQAAAANLGRFPRASEIGRDDPRIAQYAAPTPRRPPTGADAGLVPAGEPLGRTNPGDARARGTLQAANAGQAPGSARQEGLSRSERQAQARLARQEQERQARQARASRDSRNRERERPPEPVVAVSTAVPPSRAVAVAAAPAPVPAPAAVAPSPGFTVPLAAPQPNPPAASPAPGTTLVGPSFNLAPAVTPAPTPAATPVPPAAAAPPAPAPAPAKPSPPRPRRLADAFGDLAKPAISVTPTPGAVDIRRITANRSGEARARPAPPEPSRIWVQVATGRNKAALGFDWRRMAKDDAAVFRGKKPYVAAWGQTNRLLTGPFESEAAANAFVAQLRRADVEGAFLWTSPAGQVVDTLVVAK